MKKPKKPETIEEKILKMGSALLGIWRFREEKESFFWCATFVYKGYYYDVPGQQSLSRTLDIAYNKLSKLKSKKKAKG
jgi:hypothetical protein